MKYELRYFGPDHPLLDEIEADSIHAAIAGFVLKDALKINKETGNLVVWDGQFDSFVFITFEGNTGGVVHQYDINNHRETVSRMRV